MSRTVWTLSDADRKEIQDLYEKKLALENLTKIIDADNQKLYDKLVSDYGNTIRLFQEWWQTTSQKYEWEGQNWSIDFNKSEVILNDA